MQKTGFSLAVACGASALVLPSAGALANDSSAELAAGGLVLTKSAAIEMKVEDLYISTKQVKVHYVFANTSGKDVTVVVAFPMPDITTEGVDDNIALPTENAVNLLNFHTSVDDVPVHAEVEQKAVKGNVDETAFLKSLDIPLAPHLKSTNDVLDKLPKATQDKLKAMGLAIDDDYDVGHGMERHIDATWTLKTTFYWTQTFPAGRDVVVDHQYEPSVGGTSETMWGNPEFRPTDPLYIQQQKTYCVDPDFIAGVKDALVAGQAKVKQPDGHFYFAEERVDYVLTTGANWKAPIGDFTMTIDKGDPANLVSFCADGVHKVAPTQFQVHYTNFTPTRDVAVLILTPEGLN